jgi:hypothetical protein
MLDLPGTDPPQWYCPHHAHDKPGESTRHIFTDKEATDAQEAYWKGQS